MSLSCSQGANHHLQYDGDDGDDFDDNDDNDECRLSENGYQLAHRYWPEEGSEQYHIFEVNFKYLQNIWQNNTTYLR